MPRQKPSAADYLERHDAEMRLILGELVEYAGRINLWWRNAALVVRNHPERALTDLIDAEIHLSVHVRIELADSLRRIRSAITLLGEELPEDEDDASADATPTSGDVRGH
jgi:hypothetical protein